MFVDTLGERWVLGHVEDRLRKLGPGLHLDDVGQWIRTWDDWMSARGEFYDLRW